MLDKFTKTFLLILFFSVNASFAQKIYKTDLKEDVGPNSWRIIKKSYDQAKQEKADYFLVEMNTFGGAVNFADSIRTLLLNADMKTIVFVNNNAASAGTLISLACDYIYMHTGASLGAASVVNQQGEIMPEKYQSYMRGLMRATAEAKGRDAKMAEAFVDPNVSLLQWKEDGQVLTFTASEAVKANLAKAQIKGIDEIFTDLSISLPQVTTYELTFVDRIIGFLINPMISGLLIMGIMGGIYFELQTPGIGFALVLAIISASLFFAPLYLQGLADHWEIALFVIGVLLLVLEVFVIPGFGIAGVLGIIFLLCGLAFSMLANDFLDFKISKPGLLVNSFLIVVSAMIFSVALLVIFGKNIMRSSLFKRLVLADEQTAESGYTSSVPKVNLINKNGIAKTVLRPSGKIEIDGIWYDAVALDGFIEAGDQIYVEKHENYSLFVRKLEDKPIV
ncbi:nodulation protein NfeD [Sphingobacterium alkalisoli]|uniref:Nodulation protein NfeD n=1 Tax=Sphingobacterium alkalisoli TaxID=1874115 RepID=A0A4U0GUL7_9SPHI|nr:NfeD family protein [Sphingobacterium alkalisoli]TJY62668.1 nodulation protein NfeD [Sphingobacterium alkalisoli]GGH28106.1 serine protease [Sphingobacterium alkalisoli]